MSEQAPTTDNPSPKPASFLAEVFSQANITTGLAVFAVVLAAAPYVMPQLQAYQVQRGLMARPAMLIDASDKLQQQKADKTAADMLAQIKAHHDSLFNDKNDPVINPAGKIKVVEFLDYQCAYCRAATPGLHAFLANNPDVQLVVKEYPVIHPPMSVTMAQVGLAAYQAGHYEPIHYAFLHDTPKSDAEMDALLVKAGLDPKQIRVAAVSDAIKDQVTKTVQLGENLGIEGTPGFIVGNRFINGARLEDLKAAVEAVRAGK